jgi:hypothetical protein
VQWAGVYKMVSSPCSGVRHVFAMEGLDKATVRHAKVRTAVCLSVVHF